MKSLIVFMFLIMSAGVALAQSDHGVSGPDTGGSRINTDEKVLTLPDLKAIIRTCFEPEVYEMFRTISKDSSFYLTETRLLNLSSGSFHFRYTFQNVQNQTSTLEVFMIVPGSFRIIYENPTAVLKELILISYEAPTFEFVSTELPEAYDEYGNIIESRIIVTPKGFQKPFGNPVDVSKPITFKNASTYKPILGLTFNQPRYASCVSFKVGQINPAVSP